MDLIGCSSLTEVKLHCRRTTLNWTLDSLYMRQPHPPPSAPLFPFLVQEGWTLEEIPTGALTPPSHTHTHTDFICFILLVLYYFPSFFIYISPWIHHFRFFYYFEDYRGHRFSYFCFTLFCYQSYSLSQSIDFCLSVAWPEPSLTPMTMTHCRKQSCTLSACWVFSTPWDIHPPHLTALCTNKCRMNIKKGEKVVLLITKQNLSFL